MVVARRENTPHVNKLAWDAAALTPDTVEYDVNAVAGLDVRH
jgi:hypothetical protein